MNVTENQATTFDEAALLKSLDKDPVLLHEVARLFCEVDCPRLFKMLIDGLQALDGPVIYEAGHALKGLFGEMRAAHAQNLARLIEQAGQTKNFHGLDSLVLELVSETDHLKTELRIFLNANPI